LWQTVLEEKNQFLELLSVLIKHGEKLEEMAEVQHVGYSGRAPGQFTQKRVQPSVERRQIYPCGREPALNKTYRVMHRGYLWFVS